MLQPRWPRSGSQARFDAAPPRRQGEKILCRARWWSSRVVQPDMELERPLAQQVPNYRADHPWHRHAEDKRGTPRICRLTRLLLSRAQ